VVSDGGGGSKDVLVVLLTAMWSVLGESKSVMVNCDVVGGGPVLSVVPDESSIQLAYVNEYLVYCQVSAR